METETLNAEDIKISYLITALTTIGELISYHLQSADFEAIRTLKYYLDQLFIEADKAISNSKIKATTGRN